MSKAKTLKQLIDWASDRWGLNEDEDKQVRAYLRGRRLCRDYDQLANVVRAAVDDIQKKERAS